MKSRLNNLLNKLTIKEKISCQKYLFSQAERIFFWGHPLTEIYQGNLFIKLPNYTESLGFCFISSALTMFALKNDPTARLVQADVHDRGCTLRHGWVEFFHHDTWWVTDFAWSKSRDNPILQTNFYDLRNPENKWVCSYYEFWAHPTTKMLERFLLAPETSHIFGELYAYAGCQRKGGIESLGPKSLALVNNPNHGMALPRKSPTYLIPDGNPLHPVCRTAINDLLFSDRVAESNLTKIEQVMRKDQAI